MLQDPITALLSDVMGGKCCSVLNACLFVMVVLRSKAALDHVKAAVHRDYSSGVPNTKFVTSCKCRNLFASAVVQFRHVDLFLFLSLVFKKKPSESCLNSPEVSLAVLQTSLLQLRLCKSIVPGFHEIRWKWDSVIGISVAITAVVFNNGIL